MSVPDTPAKKRGWKLKRPSSSSGSLGRPSTSSGLSSPQLPVPTEGQQLNDYVDGAVLGRAATADSPTSSKRWSANLFNGSKVFSSSSSSSNNNTSDTNHDLKRTRSAQNSLSAKPAATPPEMSKAPEISKSASGSFARMMVGALSLSRTNTNTSIDDEKERGRSTSSNISRRSRSQNPSSSDPPSRSQSRARSQSPFSFRRFKREREREREASPTPSAVPLAQSDVDLSESKSTSIRPRNAFTDHDSDDETINGETTTDGETEDEDWSPDDDLDFFDPETERNTEANAMTPADAADGELDIDPDPLGEGVNVVVPPEPYFPSTLLSARNRPAATGIGPMGPKRRKSTRHHEPLPLKTNRPVFQRDRCTITLMQGDPAGRLSEDDRKKRMYIVASDLSEESRYAVEWGIGTVLRDGDEMLLVTVVENEARIDPATPNPADKAGKLRSQQERQGLAYILVRQATGLLQRTKLNVTIHCQAWHAKNARHMILDVVDHNEPVMLIVGSRGLGQLKNILLGSTSHYLIQKCSVPVMVARRRLKRPPRKSAHLVKHRTHVSLAEAAIDKVAAKVDEDVRVMRENIQRDDEERGGGSGSRNVAVAEGGHGVIDEAEMEHEQEREQDEGEGSASEDEEAQRSQEPEGVKVPGN
ncbi:hypothetical protein V5O48_001902 [Marasmius crinis-equi]|uniref:UspA domain-containing protein n=1 Tax=Marasmius crinis-equi TaxID=585013 RepID=A0ABR3FX51_9AGAR